jgi:hypothetical protein
VTAERPKDTGEIDEEWFARFMQALEQNPRLRETYRRVAWNRRHRGSWWRFLHRLGIRPQYKPRYTPRTRRAHPVVATVFPIEGFFAAHEEEIDHALVDEGPHGQVTAFEVKNMTPVEVATLGEILGAGTYSELCDRMVASARDGESGECGLFLVAPEITDRLAAATDLRGVLARWGATDELRASGFEEEDVRYVLEGVQPLAARARAEGRELWVWWSL